MIKMIDPRLEYSYPPNHGTTTAGLLKSIASAIENPSKEVLYEDADTHPLDLIQKSTKLLNHIHMGDKVRVDLKGNHIQFKYKGGLC